jgi:hypothetical protein
METFTIEEKPGLLLAAKLLKTAYEFERDRLPKALDQMDRDKCVDSMNYHKNMSDIFFEYVKKMEK